MFMLGGRCQTDAIDIMISQLKKGKTNVCVGRGGYMYEYFYARNGGLLCNDDVLLERHVELHEDRLEHEPLDKRLPML